MWCVYRIIKVKLKGGAKIKKEIGIIVVCMILGTAITGVLLAEGVKDTTTVSIDPPSQTVSPGETFTVDVYCVPSQPIKSFELKLAFDPLLLQANSVIEGNIFDGYNTSFNPGTINNTTGNIVDVYGLIIGPGNVSDPGTFATISFTATPVLGNSILDLYDVGVTNETGYVSITVNDGSVTVMTFVWVDDDFNSSTPGWNITHFDNIQDGIDAVNESGTIYVYNGTYYENVVVNKTINLIGEDRNTTIIDGSESGDVVFIDYDADWVNICGFTIRDSGSSYLNHDAGIYVESNFNSIFDNTISNNRDGIRLDYSNNNKITGNNFTSNNNYGIWLYPFSSNNTISGNNFSNNHWESIYIDYSSGNTITGNNIISNNGGGIELDYSSNNILSNNNISNNDFSIRIWAFSNSNTISGNYISNNLHGLYFDVSHYNVITGNTITSNNYSCIELEDSNSNTIIGNNITLTNGHGIQISYSSNNILSGNIITLNSDNGIDFWCSSNNTITGNTISNNGNYGIYLKNYSNYYSNNNSIYHNNLINNTQNAYDECNNTWDNGYPSGGNYFDDYTGVDYFYGPNQDINGSDGIGDTPYNISGGDNQDLNPFMNLWNGTSPVPPLDTVFVDDDYTGTTPGWQYNHFDRIQDGIDAVTRSTVYVFNGTYYENVVVNKTINLIGEDRNNTIIDGNGSGGVVYLSADWVYISGFTIQNSGSDYDDAGVYISSDYNSIYGNTISNNSGGIYLVDSNSNIIFGNNIKANNWSGIEIDESYDSTIKGNNITNNKYGIGFFEAHYSIFSGNNISENDVIGIGGWMFFHNNITGNIISNNGGDGLNLESAYNNVIFNNTIASNGNGMYLETSSDNVISKNDINSNSYDGLNTWSSNRNTFKGNNISNNGDGIYLDGSNIVITNNNISNNGDGIYLDGSGIITNNTIASNNGNGILIATSGNTLTGNTISNNDNGIRIWLHNDNNLLYLNNFINNVQNAYDEGTNTWYNATLQEGNYWDDYNGTDADGDGIGDIPYNITGGSSQDLYPLGYFHPIANFTYSVNNLTVQFNGSVSYDPDGYITQYTFYFGDNTSGAGIILNHTYVDYGTFNVTLIVTDNDGKNDTISKNIALVDLIPPGISNVQAIPSTQIPGGYVNISASVVDNVEADEVSLYIEYPDSIIGYIKSKQGDTKNFVSKRGTIENFSITQNKTGDTYYCNKTYNQIGVYTYHLWANDTSGNHNISADYTFEIINQPPYTPSNPSPPDGAINVSINVVLNWTGGDPDPGDIVTYDVYFGSMSPLPKVSSNQSDTLYAPGILDYQLTYFWKIVAWDNHGASTEGPTWSFTTEEAPMPDLDCYGSLSWTGVPPGGTVTGYFTVENIGDPSSLLDWEIEDYPNWGTWTFTPSSGDDLLPNNPVTVEVTVIAPYEPNSDFTGEVKIINKENSSDFCTIDVSLATPVNQPYPHSQHFNVHSYTKKLML